VRIDDYILLPMGLIELINQASSFRDHPFPANLAFCRGDLLAATTPQRMTASANCIAAPYRRVNVGISRAAAAISQSAKRSQFGCSDLQ
jgi:hypothetical protein